MSRRRRSPPQRQNQPRTRTFWQRALAFRMFEVGAGARGIGAVCVCVWRCCWWWLLFDMLRTCVLLEIHVRVDRTQITVTQLSRRRLRAHVEIYTCSTICIWDDDNVFVVVGVIIFLGDGCAVTSCSRPYRDRSRMHGIHNTSASMGGEGFSQKTGHYY